MGFVFYLTFAFAYKTGIGLIGIRLIIIFDENKIRNSLGFFMNIPQTGRMTATLAGRKMIYIFIIFLHEFFGAVH